MNRKWLILLLVLPLAQGTDKEKSKFTPGPIGSYKFQQTIDKVTIAAEPYDREELSREAFGKADPYKHGVLPVLMLIQNGTGKTLSLQHMKLELITPDREHVEATPAADVKYISGPDRPKMIPGPIPGRVPRPGKRNKALDAWEIEGRAFAARVLPPNETASGFFYFQAPHKMGSKLYVTGIEEAGTGKELFYFEVPLDTAAQ